MTTAMSLLIAAFMCFIVSFTSVFFVRSYYHLLVSAILKFISICLIILVSFFVGHWYPIIVALVVLYFPVSDFRWFLYIRGEHKKMKKMRKVR